METKQKIIGGSTNDTKVTSLTSLRKPSSKHIFLKTRKVTLQRVTKE